MHTYKLLFIYYALIFIWIIIFDVPTKILFLFIARISLLFFHFHFEIILVENNIGDEGAKALAEALKLNKNLN